jgi:hypothetical protein
MSKTVRTVIKTAGAGLTAKRGGEFLNRETRGTREREKAETDLTAKNTENAKHSGIINRR